MMKQLALAHRWAIVRLLIPVLLANSCRLSYSDDEKRDTSPGHSLHGEAFDEGPRQAARLMGGTGQPGFPVTTKQEIAQRFIDQGVGQLHGFWYWEAERSFRQAAFHDPECAMAYWGLAMANVNNEKRAASFIREAVKRQQNVTPRERLYIAVLSSYYEALERDNKKPEERKSEDKKTDEVSTPLAKPAGEDKPAEIKPEPTAEDPAKTPCNSPEDSSNENALNAEPKVEDAAAKLKERENDLEKKSSELTKREKQLHDKEQAAKKKEEEAAKKKQKRDRLEARQKAWDKIVQDFPDDTHAAAFLVCQTWQDRNEVPIISYTTVDTLLDRIIAKEPNHPAHHYRIHWWDDRHPTNALSAAAMAGPSAPSIAHMWHMPGHTYSKLKRFPDAVYQQEASARVDHAYMERDRVLPYQIHNYAHNNEWCIRNMLTIGRAEDALQLAKNMIEIPRHPKQNDGKDSNTAGALGRERLYEVLSGYELWNSLTDLAQSSYLAEPNISEKDEIRRRRYLGVAQAADGYPPAAEEQIAWLESFISELKAEAPALPEKPKYSKKERDDLTRRCEEAVRHVRGAISTSQGDFAAALDHYKKAGKLPKEQLAWATSRNGDHEAALKLAREEVDASPQAVVPRATLVAVLWSKGDRDAARQEFEKLRPLAAQANLSLPAFVRLREIAKELSYPEDWRLPLEPAKDLGERPALDSLGPLTWRAWQADEWNLSDHTGKQWSLRQDFGDQPVVVLFYLGFGCIHCVEQLNTFGPMANEYSAAGIKLVAISSDPVDVLHKSLRQAKQEGGFPFPLLSNAEANIFKAYRCFDDFSNVPMHGTFLIDKQQRVRWQDIGPEPFTDAKFLLQESKRLLSL